MASEAANIAALQKQIADGTNRMREHLKARIAQTQDQIAKLEVSQAAAQRALIAAQAQRNRLGELEHNVSFRLEQLNMQEKWRSKPGCKAS
jgi:septal ring factor EnvC (AmiA/AmiB activator)